MCLESKSTKLLGTNTLVLNKRYTKLKHTPKDYFRLGQNALKGRYALNTSGLALENELSLTMRERTGVTFVQRRPRRPN
jgi:hypothetical protein